MALVKTKHFASILQHPKVPPDGTSLEEQMNSFLAMLPFAKVMDVQTSAVSVDVSHVRYLGLVVYQA